jgi:hypothetical protein
MHQHQSGSIITIPSIAAVAAATDLTAYKVSKEGGCGRNACVSESTEGHVDKNGSGEVGKEVSPERPANKLASNTCPLANLR